MLQIYTFLYNHPVNKLNESLYTFFRKIESVGPNDNFDPEKYFPPELAKKATFNNELYSKSKAFFNVYKTLKNEKEIVNRAFFEMNKIQELFQNTTIRITIEDLPKPIQQVTKTLFNHLYKDTLNQIGNIKDHYEEFLKSQNNNWCPFCGMEQFTHFKHQKQDYDHLLAKSIYPFAAVNMKNLTPMCIKCNRTHKKAKDLLTLKKSQCKAINPYFKKENIRLSFEGTTLPTSTNRKGDWKLKFLPETEEVIRWNEVFKMDDRIIKDRFSIGKKTDYDVWLDDFIKMYKKKSMQKPFNEQDVRDALLDYAKLFYSEKYRDSRYIKFHLFMWIAKKAPQSFIKARQRALN